MGMAKEFKEFAMRGNVVDMAVGIIIGAAFGTIVKTLVGKVVMPVVGYFVGGIDFTKLAVTMGKTDSDPGVVVAYGEFIQSVFDFIIVAFVIFMAIRGMNNLKKKEEEAPAKPPEPSKEEVLLTEIRDALRK